MTEHNLAPIELTDDELLAVSGGRTRASAEASISQRISQSVGVAQLGGDVGIGGGNGATTVTNATFSQTFSATTTTNQTATNTNSGNASATASASSVES
jgi:DNA-binding transcriptional regulator LsrR (DeoR family)